jgi:tRNA A37 threonylcarbamoyladenosine biosynthesis protein TsaE
MQINEALRDLFNEATKPIVLAIDGPAGSGKSTLAGEIARAFAGQALSKTKSTAFSTGLSTQKGNAGMSESPTIDGPHLVKRPTLANAY